MLQDKEGIPILPHAGWQFPPPNLITWGISTTLQHPVHVPERMGLPGVSWGEQKQA